MSEAHLEEFLSQSELENWQRAELVQSSDKTTAYQKQIFWHRLGAAKKSLGSFHNYLITNGIFLQPELKSQLREISDLLWDALNEKEIEEQHPSPRAGRFAKSERVRKEGQEMLKTVEDEVYARLWRETKIN